MHATTKSAAASTGAIDLTKEVFELAFADANAYILERRRLNRTAFPSKKGTWQIKPTPTRRRDLPPTDANGINRRVVAGPNGSLPCHDCRVWNCLACPCTSHSEVSIRAQSFY